MKHLQEMMQAAPIAYLEGLRARLADKQRREQVYLASRKRRKIHTPTDIAIQADIVMEDELLAVLSELIDKERSNAGHENME